jgi:hypothetical protein
MAEQRAEHKDLERRRRETQKAPIREQVIHVLGEPAGLRKVQVRPLC